MVIKCKLYGIEIEWTRRLGEPLGRGFLSRILVRDRIDIAIKHGCFRYDYVEFKLVSGRTFRYQMQDYPFPLLASDEELDAICCRIIRDKYRYCEWDRAHPKTNTEIEIYDALLKWMKEEVGFARKIQMEAAKTESVVAPDPADA